MSVQDLAKSVQNQLRQVDRFMFSDKEKGWEILESLKEDITILRNSLEESAAKIAVSKFDRLEKDLARRLGKTVVPEIASKTIPKPVTPTITPNASGIKVNIRQLAMEIPKILRIINTFIKEAKINEAKTNFVTLNQIMDQIKAEHPNEMALKQAERQIPAIKEQLDRGLSSDLIRKVDLIINHIKNEEFNSVVSDWENIAQFHKFNANHPDIVTITNKVVELQNTMASANAAKDEDQKRKHLCEEQSEKIIEQLKVYLGWGTPEETLPTLVTEIIGDFIGREPIINHIEKLLLDINSRDLSAITCKAYRDGKTDELIEYQQKLVQKIANFKQAKIDSITRYCEALNKQISYQENALKDNTVITFRNDVQSDLQKKIDQLTMIIPKDQRLLDIQQRFNNLITISDTNRKATIANRHMLPMVYNGPDQTALEQLAISIVQIENPLKVSLISLWKEEEGWTFTDTTKTATRYRVTRGMQAQIAAPEIDQEGIATLYTVYLESEKQSDGSWSDPKGHLQFTDLILQDNIE